MSPHSHCSLSFFDWLTHHVPLTPMLDMSLRLIARLSTNDRQQLLCTRHSSSLVANAIVLAYPSLFYRYPEQRMGHPPPPPPPGQARYQRSLSPEGSRHSAEHDSRDPHAHSRSHYPQHRLQEGETAGTGYRDGNRPYGREDERSARSQHRDYHADSDHAGRRLEQLSLSGSQHAKVCLDCLQQLRHNSINSCNVCIGLGLKRR